MSQTMQEPSALALTTSSSFLRTRSFSIFVKEEQETQRKENKK
jgi:hypothetical protein